MKSETRQILNDPALLAARESHFDRLKALFAGRTLDSAFVLCGAGGSGKANLYEEPEKWVDEALDDLATKAGCLRDPVVFRPLYVGPWPYGVYFIDRMFGARVYDLEPPNCNWQAEPLDKPVGTLEPPDLDRDTTWALARRMASAFCDAGVSVPLFVLPVLSSPLNIGLNLYGQRLLAAMLADPDAARRDLRIITGLIATLHRWYRNNIPFAQLQMVEGWGRIQPPAHGQLCGCSTQLLSGPQYEEFIAPLDDEVLSIYPGGGLIHLCGSHTQHIPVWRRMASLCAVQINDRAAEDLETYFNELRDNQIIYVNPFGGMSVERIMQVTGGRRIVIPGDFKEPLPTRPGGGR